MKDEIFLLSQNNQLLQKKIENVYKNNMVIPNEHYENRTECKIEEIEFQNLVKILMGDIKKLYNSQQEKDSMIGQLR